MAQYCRYCHHMVIEQGGYYCPLKDRYLSTKTVKHTNECDSFLLNAIDGMRVNPKGYQPTGVKPVELGGLGKQIKMDEIIREVKNEQG